MAGSTSNIRLIYCEDSFQRREAIAEIQKKRYGDEEVECLYFTASAGETPRALEEILSFSLLSPNRIVVLDGLEKVPVDHLNALVEYANHPCGDVPFLWMAETEKKTPAALRKAIDKKYVRVLKKTDKSAIRKQVLNRCAEKQVTFDRKALEFFLQSCNGQMDITLRELDKLLLWTDEKGTIGLDLCSRLVQTEEEEDIWAITNAVGDRDAPRALKALDRLLSQGDDEIAITGRLITTFRTLYHFKSLAAEDLSAAEIGKRTGKKDFVLKKNLSQSKGFSLVSLRRAIHMLRQADNDLKGGRAVPSSAHKRIVLERLTIDLCGMS